MNIGSVFRNIGWNNIYSFHCVINLGFSHLKRSARATMDVCLFVCVNTVYLIRSDFWSNIFLSFPSIYTHFKIYGGWSWECFAFVLYCWPSVALCRCPGLSSLVPNVFSLGYGVTKPKFKNSQKIGVLSKLYNICAVVLGVRQENLGPKVLRGRGVRGHFKETWDVHVCFQI